MKLLFVCSGNLCRSPMAERLAVRLGDDLGIPVEARSASALGLRDQPAEPGAVRVCREVGIDLSDHRAQPLTEDLLRWADRVLVMEIAHAVAVRERAPWLGDDDVVLMGPLVGRQEIADPIGGWTFQFRRTRRQLEHALAAWLPSEQRRRR